MNYLRHLIKSKGVTNLLSRALMIYQRFGFTRKKSKEALQRIVEINHKHGCIPSFFIAAELLERHWELFSNICHNGVHVGLHGYHHIDYAQMSGAAQEADIARGLEKFREHGLKVSGFRAPFLRFNDETSKVASDKGIDWVSHSTMLFDGNICLDGQESRGNVRHLLGDFYTTRSHTEEPSLPRWEPHCLEIPVSLPDDELLVDRLGIRDPIRLREIWLDMLDSSRRQGELLNFILHPERIDYVAQPLDALLEQANSYGDVWVGSLDEIAKWWQQRNRLSFEITKSQNDTYKVDISSSAGGCLALQHPGGKLEFLKAERNGTIIVRTHFKPVIAISKDCSENDIRHLTNEGFVVDLEADPARCAFVYDCCCRENKRQLEKAVKHARGPLLRFWRWPEQFRSALAITADIDAITFWDFFRRAFHFYKMDRRTAQGAGHRVRSH